MKTIDYETLLDLSRKIILLNSDKMKIGDLGQILMCAKNLDRVETDKQDIFDMVMGECLEIVLEDLQVDS
jgi:hypothetical protein